MFGPDTLLPRLKEYIKGMRYSRAKNLDGIAPAAMAFFDVGVLALGQDRHTQAAARHNMN